jgi:hypothetical protein
MFFFKRVKNMFSFNKFDAHIRNSRELVCESNGSLNLKNRVYQLSELNCVILFFLETSR